MDKYTFEMIPGLIGEIAELLRSIDTKLDKLTATVGEPRHEAYWRAQSPIPS